MTWFRFYAVYQESAVQGGYSATMNMKRLQEDPAPRHVRHFFNMPQRLQDLIDDLYEKYGQNKGTANVTTAGRFQQHQRVLC